MLGIGPASGFTGAPGAEPRTTLAAMAQASRAEDAERNESINPLGALGASGRTGAVAIDPLDGSAVVVVGHPTYAGLSHTAPSGDVAAAFLRDWRTIGIQACAKIGGDFALALHDVATRTTVLLADRIGTPPLTAVDCNARLSCAG